MAVPSASRSEIRPALCVAGIPAMRIVTVLLSLLAVAGCTAVVPRNVVPSPCVLDGEASYACQVERYENVNAN
jgi:hypothetical protein